MLMYYYILGTPPKGPPCLSQSSGSTTDAPAIEKKQAKVTITKTQKTKVITHVL